MLTLCFAAVLVLGMQETSTSVLDNMKVRITGRFLFVYFPGPQTSLTLRKFFFSVFSFIRCIAHLIYHHVVLPGVRMLFERSGQGWKLLVPPKEC